MNEFHRRVSEVIEEYQKSQKTTKCCGIKVTTTTILDPHYKYKRKAQDSEKGGEEKEQCVRKFREYSSTRSQTKQNNMDIYIMGFM